MRLLFTFAGGTGHFVPLGALATVAAAAGHTLAFACQSAMLRTVRAAGFVSFNTGGPTLRTDSTRTELLEYDASAEDRVVSETFAGTVARERASRTRALCEQWGPDALIRDEFDFGAAMISECLNLPHACVLVNASGSFVRKSLILEPLNNLRADYALPPDPDLCMLSRGLTLSPFPPSFRGPAFPLPPGAQSVRPLFLENAGTVPDVHNAVYVTLGTIFNLESGDLFERLLAAVCELERDVVLTIGNELDPAAVGPMPPNVHVARYIPQSLILPRCSAMVSHAGSGSVMGALAHGLPSVLLPMGADQPQNAARCAALGAARALNPLHATPAEIRDALLDVLGDPSFRTAAEAVRQEISGLPGPESALSLVEALAR